MESPAVVDGGYNNDRACRNLRQRKVSHNHYEQVNHLMDKRPDGVTQFSGS